jgi:hypothetical protein
LATCSVTGTGSDQTGEGVFYTIPAPTYCRQILRWIITQFDDPELFPINASIPFPPHFMEEIKKMALRLSRVYAHMKATHAQDLEFLGILDSFSKSHRQWVQFVRSNELIDDGPKQRAGGMTRKMTLNLSDCSPDYPLLSRSSSSVFRKADETSPPPPVPALPSNFLGATVAALSPSSPAATSTKPASNSGNSSPLLGTTTTYTMPLRESTADSPSPPAPRRKSLLKLGLGKSESGLVSEEAAPAVPRPKANSTASMLRRSKSAKDTARASRGSLDNISTANADSKKYGKTDFTRPRGLSFRAGETFRRGSATVGRKTSMQEAAASSSPLASLSPAAESPNSLKSLSFTGKSAETSTTRWQDDAKEAIRRLWYSIVR